jgi:hypothetical protein
MAGPGPGCLRNGDLERFVQAEQGLIEPAGFDATVGQAKKRVEVARVGLQDLTQVRDGLVVLPDSDQRNGEIVADGDVVGLEGNRLR